MPFTNPITDARKWTITLCNFFDWIYIKESTYQAGNKSDRIFENPLYSMDLINAEMNVDRRSAPNTNNYTSIYYLELDEHQSKAVEKKYNTNRRRDLKRAKKTFTSKSLNTNESLRLLSSKQYQEIHNSFFISFGVPPLPIGLLIKLVSEKQISLIAAYENRFNLNTLKGIISITSNKKEYWIPWIIYNKLTKCGLSTFLWHEAIVFACDHKARLVNLGTSLEGSGPANFKKSLGCSSIRIAVKEIKISPLTTTFSQFVLKRMPHRLLRLIGYHSWRKFGPYV